MTWRILFALIVGLSVLPDALAYGGAAPAALVLVEAPGALPVSATDALGAIVATVWRSSDIERIAWGPTARLWADETSSEGVSCLSQWDCLRTLVAEGTRILRVDVARLGPHDWRLAGTLVGPERAFDRTWRRRAGDLAEVVAALRVLASESAVGRPALLHLHADAPGQWALDGVRLEGLAPSAVQVSPGRHRVAWVGPGGRRVVRVVQCRPWQHCRVSVALGAATPLGPDSAGHSGVVRVGAWTSAAVAVAAAAASIALGIATQREERALRAACPGGVCSIGPDAVAARVQRGRRLARASTATGIVAGVAAVGAAALFIVQAASVADRRDGSARRAGQREPWAKSRTRLDGGDAPSAARANGPRQRR